MKKEKKERHSLKFIAIFFSLFLWFFVLSSESIEVVRTLKLSYQHSSDLELANLAPSEIKIKIKGSKAFIKTVMNDGDLFTINLDRYTSKKPNVHFVNLNAKDLSLPFGIEVVSIQPKEFKVILDRSVEMELPIQLQFKNQLEKYRTIEKFEVFPGVHKAVGPQNVMTTLTHLKTEPIDLSKIDKNQYEALVSLSQTDKRVRFKNGKSFKVSIQSKIKK